MYVPCVCVVQTDIQYVCMKPGLSFINQLACVCVCLTKVQHVHVIVADGSVPSTKYIDLPLLHHTRRVTDRKKNRMKRESQRVGQNDVFKMCV